MKKRICVVTSSRADYGLLCWVMKEIQKSKKLELVPVVTGTHLSKKFGYTIKEVIRDGIKNINRIKISDDTSPYAIAKSSSQLVNKFANFFKQEKIDFLLLLGDRFEMLAVAIAALPYNIPIGHIGGGEITEGAIDDNVRHCLTKLSHFHFAITQKCANRIKQMGEESWRVKVVGSPRIDSKNNVSLKTKKELTKKFGISFKGKTALVVYHPVTLETKNTKKYISELLTAIKNINIETIMFYPNMDTSSDIIIERIEKFAKVNKNVKLFKPLEMNDYLSVLYNVDVLIGNSSIAIIEAPLFCLPAVNIGNRQKGRDRVKNIIDVKCNCEDIVQGVNKALYDKRFLHSLKGMKNPYGDGKASKHITKILEKINLNEFKIMKKNCFK